MITLEKTERGFVKGSFTDSYDNKCSIQESSGVVPRLWLGVDLDFSDKECTRMHLTQNQVRDLIPLLTFFARNGYLPK